MINLIDVIPENEKEMIVTYAKRFSGSHFSIGLNNFLNDWAENSIELYKLLGNQLIYKFPFEIDKSENLDMKVYEKIVDLQFIRHINRICLLNRSTPFFNNLWYHFIDNAEFFYTSMMSNKITFSDKMKCTLTTCDESMSLTLEKGIKFSKFFGKLLNMFQTHPTDFFIYNEKVLASLPAEFEEFRLEVSKISQEKLKGTLCLSIHPLDYMTMSDNSNNWTSCMSWKNRGCYRLGTYETMNAGNKIVAYVESEKKFTKIKRGIGTWNSKIWRTLIFNTESGFYSSKQYPNPSDGFVKLALEKLAELSNQDYKSIEKYNPYDNTLRYQTLFMYNDIEENKDYCHFFRIHLSNAKDNNNVYVPAGSVYCLECGEYIDSENSSSESDFICDFCYDKLENIKYTCERCDSDISLPKAVILDTDQHQHVVVCTDCYNDVEHDVVTDEELYSSYRIFYYSHDNLLTDCADIWQNRKRSIMLTGQQYFKLANNSEVFEVVKRSDRGDLIYKKPLGSTKALRERVKELLLA